MFDYRKEPMFILDNKNPKLEKVELCQKGDFVKMPKGKEVYKYEGFSRSEKKYILDPQSGGKDFKYVKKGTIVQVDFYY